MDDALKLKVKDALKKADLDEGLVDDINITDEKKIPDEVKKIKNRVAAEEHALTQDEFLKAIKEAKLGKSLESYLKSASESEIDRRVEEAVKTHDAKLKREVGEAEEKARKEKEREKMTDEQKVIVTLTETVDALTKRVENLSQSTSKEALRALKVKALQTANLDEKYVDRILTGEPEKVADEVAGFKKDIQGEQQKKIDELIKEGKIPEISAGSKTLAEDVAVKYAKDKNVESTKGGVFPAKKLGIEEDRKAS